MGLTSLALAIVLGCAVAVVLGIVLGRWRWLAGPGPGRLALRAGGLAVLQASVLCLVFVLVNRSLVFYSSWSDLLGTDNGGGQVAATRTERVGTAGWLRVLRVSRVSVPGVPAAGGRLETVQLHGQLSGLTVPARLYLPPGFRWAPSAQPARNSPPAAAGRPDAAAASAGNAPQVAASASPDAAVRASASGGGAARAASPAGGAVRAIGSAGAAVRAASRAGTAPRATASQPRRYPVIVAITGRASTGDSPYAADHLAAAVAAEIAAGRLRPVILLVLPAGVGTHDSRGPGGPPPATAPPGPVPPGTVPPGTMPPGTMPPGTVPPGQAGCLNVPGGRPGETFVAEDVPRLLQHNFRASRAPWALLGDQAGGYCSLLLAFSNPDAFAVAAVPKGGYAQPPAPELAGGSPQVEDQEDPAWLLRHQPAPPVSVLFAGPGGASGSRGATGQGGTTEQRGATGQRGATRPGSTARVGRAASLAALGRPPLRMASASLARGRFPLAPVLDWIGSALGRDAWG